MKTKTFKRIAAATAAIVMMSAVPMSSISAQSSIKIDTYTNDSADGITRNYQAYKIFGGTAETLDGKTVLTGLTWGNGVVSTKLIDALIAANGTGKPLAGYFSTLSKSPYSDAATVAAALENIASQNNNALNYALSRIFSEYGILNSTNKIQLTAGAAKDVDDGYYVVIDETTLSDPDNPSALSANYLLVAGNVDIAPKVDRPTLDKNIVENKGTQSETESKANTAAIGDTVNYRLKSTVPDMTGYNKYYFIVNDTLDDGLTLNYDPKSDRTTDKSFTVKLKKTGETDVTLNDITNISGTTDSTPYDTNAAAYYVVQKGQEFKIVFTNFIKNQTYKGYDIVIDYSATLNTNAKYGTTTIGTGNDSANKNTVDLTYSNNPSVEYGNGKPGADSDDSSTPNDETKPRPNEPSDGKHPDPSNPGDQTPTIPDEPTSDTPDSVVYTYTSKLVINKVDGNNTALTGAGFAIYKGTKAQNGTITYDNNKFKEVLSPTGASAISTFTFEGLDSGCYKIVETQVPEGYNKAADIEFEIKGEIKQNNDVNWTKDGSTLISVSASTYSGTIKNNKGATLPSTGGIGTTIFYISGGVLVLGAGVVLITKKRMSLKEDK